MFRPDLIDSLRERRISVSELARELDIRPRELEDDLEHLRKSLKHSGYREVFEPAVCRQCGFVFRQQRLRKPGKCPRCKGTWISEPRLGIEVQR